MGPEFCGLISIGGSANSREIKLLLIEPSEVDRDSKDIDVALLEASSTPLTVPDNHSFSNARNWNRRKVCQSLQE